MIKDKLKRKAGSYITMETFYLAVYIFCRSIKAQIADKLNFSNNGSSRSYFETIYFRLRSYILTLVKDPFSFEFLLRVFRFAWKQQRE